MWEHGVCLVQFLPHRIGKYAILFDADGLVVVWCVGDCVAITQELVTILLPQVFVPEARVLESIEGGRWDERRDVYISTRLLTLFTSKSFTIGRSLGHWPGRKTVHWTKANDTQTTTTRRGRQRILQALIVESMVLWSHSEPEINRDCCWSSSGWSDTEELFASPKLIVCQTVANVAMCWSYSDHRHWGQLTELLKI